MDWQPERVREGSLSNAQFLADAFGFPFRASHRGGLKLWRIVPALAKRMAAHDPPHAFGRSHHDAVFLHGLNKVNAARRLIPASRTDQRADGDLIEPHHPNQ